MIPEIKYYRPGTVEEALKLLETSNGEARLIAGGTDIIPGFQQESKRFVGIKTLIDTKSIFELCRIESEKDLLKIGAGCTFSEIQNNQQISEFFPLLTKKGEWTQAPVFFHFPHYTHATSPATALIDDNWKLIRFYNNPEGEQYFLFNLEEDPYEQYDLAGTNSKKLGEMIALMQKYLTGTVSEMPLSNPAFDVTLPGEMTKEHYYEQALKERVEKEKALRNAE